MPWEKPNGAYCVDDYPAQAPRASDNQRAIEELSTRYRAMLDIINNGGGIDAYKAAIPFFKEIHEEGKKYNVGFDPQPTVLLHGNADPDGWVIATTMTKGDSVTETTVYLEKITNSANFLTESAKQALRFSRKQDAETFIKSLPTMEVRGVFSVVYYPC